MSEHYETNENVYPHKQRCHVPKPVLEDDEGTITITEYRRRTETLPSPEREC